MVKFSRRLGKSSWPMVSIAFLAATICVFAALPARAQAPREFKPLPRGQMYDQKFLADFWTALGSKPKDRTWVEESETVRLLVTAGAMAVKGDVDGAMTTLDIIPTEISSAFPFLTTMHEDLLIPDILKPWYTNEQARTMLFKFYQDSWLPHPEYRDNFRTFRDDTKGRASRTDQATPAVWIMANLATYGFVPDKDLTQDEPYLFLWDLLTGLTHYAQRATYYGLQWDNYNANKYKIAVVAKMGETIKAAHEKAATLEMSRGFWGDLLNRYSSFEEPTQGVPATGQQPAPGQPAAESQTETQAPETPTEQAPPTVSEVHEPTHAELFTPPGQTPPSAAPSEAEKTQEIESHIQDLESRVAAEREAAGGQPAAPPEAAPPAVQPPAETPPATPTPPAAQPPAETTPATPAPTPPAEQPAPSETPNEFQPAPSQTPSESAPKPSPPSELGNYAVNRLGEIATDLKGKIEQLAKDLGQETVDLVMLYNDVNVSQDTIKSAEERYIAKREAFLAGLAVWDRFNMEVYSPLTLADFNALIISDLKAPYEQLKSSDTQWSKYKASQDKFDAAFGQIETGVRGRRDDSDVLAAENAALTAYLPDYNDMVKEIEDLLSGAVTGPGH